MRVIQRRCHAFICVATGIALCISFAPSPEVRGTQAVPRIYIAAAADLRFALEDIAHQFESQQHVQVGLSFGSSGQLATQIEQGAPFDVFFSANEAFVQQLAAHDLILKDTIVLYGIGRIVLWVRANSPVDVSHGLGALLDERVRFVAIANPAHAPYGQAAVEAFQAAGVYSRLQSKLVLGENIGQTLQFVQTGNADAAIVALSLVVPPSVRETGRYWVIPAYLHRPIRQAGGVLTRSENRQTARAFLAFVSSPVGRSTMRRHGFTLPGEGF